MSKRELKPEEIGRYSRQIVLKRWGISAQEKLKNATVTIVGLGGLGTVVASQLAKVGVGKIRLIDADKVEDINLSAQLLHWDEDVGKLKVESVKAKIEKMNPFIEVEAIPQMLSEENAEELLKGSDVVVDATDNMIARGIINKTCVKLGIPFVHAGILGFRGQVMTIIPGEGPCLACIFSDFSRGPRGCPVVGAAVSVLASIQALEVIKLITGIGKPLVGRLLLFDGYTNECDIIEVNRRDDCPVCGKIKTIKVSGKPV